MTTTTFSFIIVVDKLTHKIVDIQAKQDDDELIVTNMKEKPIELDKWPRLRSIDSLTFNAFTSADEQSLHYCWTRPNGDYIW